VVGYIYIYNTHVRDGTDGIVEKKKRKEKKRKEKKKKRSLDYALNKIYRMNKIYTEAWDILYSSRDDD